MKKNQFRKEFEYGVWYDISLYYKYIDQLDWALVQFEEKLKDESKFRGRFYPLPVVCEYRKDDDYTNGKWITEGYDPSNGVGEEEIEYINKNCKPVAFMLWKPFDKSYVFNEVCDDSECCNECKPDDEERNVYGSKIEDVKRIKELEFMCAKLTTLVSQLTYELFEEKLDDIVKEREND